MRNVQPLRVTREPQAVSRFPYERFGDAELVQAVARGDTEAVGAVWDRYSALVRGVLRGSLGVQTDVEDLLQEVFIVFLKGAGDLRSAAALRGYLVAVAVRLVLVELRRRRVRRWVTLSPNGEVPDLPTPPRDVEAAEALRGLYRLLDSMPPRRRLAFTLRHVQGLEVAEVARVLNISDSTVKREAAHARSALLARAPKSEPSLWEFLERMEGKTHG